MWRVGIIVPMGSYEVYTTFIFKASLSRVGSSIRVLSLSDVAIRGRLTCRDTNSIVIVLIILAAPAVANSLCVVWSYFRIVMI